MRRGREILAGQVGQEGQCGTIQEDSCQELASVVMEEISMEVQLKESHFTTLAYLLPQ